MIQTVKVTTEIVFEETGCSDASGSAKMGFPFENVSECQVKDLRECNKNNINSDYCKDLKERFVDDCDGFSSQEECDEYWNNLNPPICDENTPPGTTCIDEGDPDDCEPGFVDRGSGCEPEHRLCLPFEGPGGCNFPPVEEGEEPPEPEIIDEDDTPEPEEPIEEEEEEASSEDEEDNSSEDEEPQFG